MQSYSEIPGLIHLVPLFSSFAVTFILVCEEEEDITAYTVYIIYIYSIYIQYMQLRPLHTVFTCVIHLSLQPKHLKLIGLSQAWWKHCSHTREDTRIAYPARPTSAHG